MMLDGFRSRCRNRRAWASWSASAISPATPQGIGQRQCAVLQPAVERFARDVLHHEEQRIAVFANFENLADVRMIDRGDGHRLAAQPLARVRVSRQLAWQQLDGDLTIEPRVAGAIDLAHASSPEGGHNLVAAESRAGCKRQTWQTGRILARMGGSHWIPRHYAEVTRDRNRSAPREPVGRDTTVVRQVKTLPR